MTTVQWLSPRQAHEQLRELVSLRQIHRWCLDGTIRGAVRVGPTRRLRLPAESLDGLLRPAAENAMLSTVAAEGDAAA